MKKKKKRKTDHEVLEELFPPEIVEEVDDIVRQVDGEPRRENPTLKRLPKPWTPKWIEEKKREEE